MRTTYRALTGLKLVTTLAHNRPGAARAADPAQITRQTLKRLATRHLGLHAEVAAIDEQLASEAAGYITGVVLDIDGGISIGSSVR